MTKDKADDDDQAISVTHHHRLATHPTIGSSKPDLALLPPAGNGIIRGW